MNTKAVCGRICLRHPFLHGALRIGLSLILLAIVLPCAAQGTISIYEEQGKLIKGAEAIGKLGPDLFGDSVNLSTGALEFVQTDVSLPGNNALPVSIGRRFVVDTEAQEGTHFGGWDLEIPRIHGTFATADGWAVATGHNKFRRCSYFSAPPDGHALGPDGWFSASEFWHGTSFYLPGSGDQELLIRSAGNNQSPTDGYAYPLVTKEGAAVRCIDRDPGSRVVDEGFEVRTPDGTLYRFDHMVSRRASSLTKGNPAPLPAGAMPVPPTETPAPVGDQPHVPILYQLERSEFWMLPSVITDRYGNTVTYSWDASNPWRLNAITASDGRRLTIGYGPKPESYTITSVSEGYPSSSPPPRTWVYTYSPNDFRVTLPDNTQWIINLAGISAERSMLAIQGGSCDVMPPRLSAAATGSMTHPSGAVGTFSVATTTHGRSWVLRDCFVNDDSGNSSAVYPREFPVLSLLSKTLSGAGLPAGGYTWSYAYGPSNHCWDPNTSQPGGTNICTSRSPTTTTTTVTDPENDQTRYTFGNRANVNEGQLLIVEAGLVGTSAKRRTTTSYRTRLPGDLYPAFIGDTPQTRGDYLLSTTYTPEEQRTIIQDGVNFTWQANTFDARARPLKVTKSSTLGYSKIETTAYDDNTAKWILGQTASVALTGVGDLISNTYRSDATLETESRFGALQRTVTWNADGTLWKTKDARNKTTTYSDYKRGIPQTILLATNDTASAVVNDRGEIDSITNEAGYKTSYQYDALSRLAKITYPLADSTSWNVTNLAFTPVTGSEYGLTGTHWRHTMSTGNGQTTTWFDALWRPVLSRTEDTGDSSNTSRAVLRRFDSAGQETFVSYPQRAITSINATLSGTTSAHDALGRLTDTSSTSELGDLTTSVRYLSGFEKRVTNPRDYITTTQFQAFDSPDDSAPVTISAPENVTTTIDRNLLGNPRWMKRSGPYGLGSVSATRWYVYDSNQRLCKRVEPESKASLFAYDAANNLDWSASGLNLTSTTLCQTESVPALEKAVNTYDNRNRLIATTYSDGLTANTGRTWTPDGLPWTVTSSGSTWTYLYNKRRLLETETLAYDAKSFRIDWAHDANGHVSGLIYPDLTNVDFAPDALGQPTKAGEFASSVKYYPNGAMERFTYGNGILHTLTQNGRLLPQVSKDGGVMNFTYAFDRNANVASITDNLAGAIESRSMQYDDLDRLISVNAPSLWGPNPATYTYDPLDNLRTSALDTRSCTHTYLGTINRLTSISGANCPTINYSNYDTRGNVRQRGDQTLNFDLANRLNSVNISGGASESYVYDAEGRRIRITRTGNAKTYQIYSQAGQLLAEEAPDGKVTNYVHLNGSLIARTGVSTTQTPPPTPAAPSVNPAISTTGQYAVSWSIPNGVTSMILLESINASASLPISPPPAVGATSWSPPVARESGSYAYSLRACTTTAGCSVAGPSATMWVVRAPTGLTYAPNPLTPNTPYTVSWNAVSSATSYSLEENIGGTWSQVYAGSNTHFSRSGRPAGSYPYRVKACRNATCSTVSAVVTVLVDVGVCTPVRPASISVSPNTITDPNANYTVTWPASTSGCVTSYKLEELFDSTNWITVTLSDTQNQQRQWSPSPPKTISGQYAYRVAACGGGICSPDSAYTPGVVVTLPGSLAFPGGLKACQTNVIGTPHCEDAGSLALELWGNRNHGYRVSWNPVATATRYEYKVLSSSANQWNPTESAPVSITTTSVESGGNPADFGGWFERTYSIRACNGSNCSSWTSPPVTIYAEAISLRAALTATYYHTDALGSPVVETDASGQEIPNSRRRYEPYGKTLSASAQGPGYTGHVTDAMTGFSYMQQRYYDPLAGRFLSVDPVAATQGSFNRYWYAHNNPYSFTDPDGRQDCRSCEMSYGAAVGIMMGDNPEAMRVWAGGEAAATSAAGHGDAAVEGAAIGQAVSEFARNPEVSGKEVARLAALIVIAKITHGKKTGHYTNTHESGKKYHGKGSEERMQRSAAEKAKTNSDPVVDSKHTATETTREAFKGEARAIQADGGPGQGNYNIINSPGLRYINEDRKP